MEYTGMERRKFARVVHPFLVYYSALGRENELDLTQMKNISMGGALFTTNAYFEKGTNLALRIRLPGSKDPVVPVARVIESRHSSSGIRFYDTRVEFSSINESDKKILAQTLQAHFK